MDEELRSLEREARYLHGLFFAGEIPPVVALRYAEANRLCFPALEGAARRIMDAIVTRRLDAEAIELTLRLGRRGGGLLTRKIQILFYLVEVRSAYYGYFINQTPGQGHAVSRMTAACLRTVWKAFKGWYLIRRYGLV